MIYLTLPIGFIGAGGIASVQHLGVCTVGLLNAYIFSVVLY